MSPNSNVPRPRSGVRSGNDIPMITELGQSAGAWPTYDRLHNSVLSLSPRLSNHSNIAFVFLSFQRLLPECIKSRHFQTQNRKIFWGGGNAPSQTPPHWGGGHPLPKPHLSAPRYSRLRRSTLPPVYKSWIRHWVFAGVVLLKWGTRPPLWIKREDPIIPLVPTPSL